MNEAPIILNISYLFKVSNYWKDPITITLPPPKGTNKMSKSNIGEHKVFTKD